MSTEHDPSRADLAKRLDRVERMLGITREPTAHDPEQEAGGTISYGGSAPWENGHVAWHQDRTWGQIIRVDPDAAASVFATLSNPVRVEIVIALLHGERATSALVNQLDNPSTGQLHHHLRELLAAGVIHQPRRGTYAIRHQHVVLILTMLSACTDLAQVPA